MQREPMKFVKHKGRDVRVPGKAGYQSSYNCGRAGHIARTCRQARRSMNCPDETAPTEEEDATQSDPVARNHTTRPSLPNRASKNAIYIRGTIHGRPQLCLIDTGSEVSLVPASTVEGLELRSCNRSVMAA